MPRPLSLSPRSLPPQIPSPSTLRRMLFHIQHGHDETTCPFDAPETVTSTFGSVLPSLAEHGINVVGAWVDPPGHQFFFVVETDDYAALVDGLAPIMTSGSATIRPINDMQTQVAKRMADVG